MLADLDLAWKVICGAIAARWVLAEALSLTRRSPSAHGDADLCRRLAPLLSRRSRDLGVVVVDLDAPAPVRLAFAGAADGARRFEIGSVTKVLTGMLVADAIDRGELDIDTRVDELVAALAGRAAGTLTVRELCTHTSGLARLGGVWVLIRGYPFALLGLDPYAAISVATLWRRAARARLRSRGSYRYSNFGAALAGELVAAAVGRPFADLLEERILTPLAMTGAGLSGPELTAPWGRAASGQRRQPWRTGAESPAGGGVATLTDMAALIVGLLDGRAPGRRSLMDVPDVATSSSRRRSGLFWVLDREPHGAALAWHNGATGGYSAFLALTPHAGRGVVVLSSCARPREAEEIALALMPSG